MCLNNDSSSCLFAMKMASNNSEITYPGLIGRTYQPQVVLGEGSFGRVLKCRDQKTRGIVAVKHHMGEHSFLAGRHESSVLKELRRIILEGVNIIGLHHTFKVIEDEEGLGVLVKVVYRFSLKEVRPIATQLFVALKDLRGGSKKFSLSMDYLWI